MRCCSIILNFIFCIQCHAAAETKLNCLPYNLARDIYLMPPYIFARAYFSSVRLCVQRIPPCNVCCVLFHCRTNSSRLPQYPTFVLRANELGLFLSTTELLNKCLWRRNNSSWLREAVAVRACVGGWRTERRLVAVFIYMLDSAAAAEEQVRHEKRRLDVCVAHSGARTCFGMKF
jgi:hypothetical protein